MTMVSKEELIKELKTLVRNNGGSRVTRDFFRNHSAHKDAWCSYWSSFKEFMAEAHPRPPKQASIVEQSIELEKAKIEAKQSGLDKKVKVLTERNLALEKSLEQALHIMRREPDAAIISPLESPGKSESAAVVELGDWHVEERVEPSSTNGLNTFNPDVARKRAARTFSSAASLVKMFRRDTAIKNWIVALTGDFITGRIHAGLSESNYMPPSEAIAFAEDLLVSGIEFLFSQFPDTHFTLVCTPGNHGRITEKQRGITEHGNSLETIMYYHLRQRFSSYEKAKFVIPRGYHAIVDLFNGAYKIRVHHGHSIRFSGGIGGVTVPLLKQIARWNTGMTVDLDLLGHFHQYIDLGCAVVNGSLIGFNDYALRGGFSFQRPIQALFLVNKNHAAKSITAPIFCDR